MICGENNHNVHDVHDVQDVHDSYEEEMAQSSDVNDTDKEESKKSIVHETFHKPSSENICLDVSESECNSDVPTNVITEFKYDEHIEPSVNVKGESYSNIFECGRNLLDQLDVTYQRAFTASAKPPSAPTGYYEPSPAREIFYDLFADHIVDKNNRIDEDEICKAVDYMKSEYEEEHERTIKDMIQDGDYKSPW